MKVLVVFAALATLATASLTGGKAISLQDDGSLIVNDIGKGVIISKPMLMLQDVPDTLMANGLELQQTTPGMPSLRGQIPWWMMNKKTPMVNMMIHKTPNMFSMNSMIGKQHLPWWKWQTTPVGMKNINNMPMMDQEINNMDRQRMIQMMRLQDMTPMMRLQDTIPMIRSQEMTPMMRLQDMTPLTRSQEMTPMIRLQDMTPTMHLQDMAQMMRLQDTTPTMRMQDMTPLMRLQDRTPMMRLQDIVPMMRLDDMTPDDMFHSGRVMGINHNWPIDSSGLRNNDFTKKNAFWNINMKNVNLLKARRLMEDDLSL